MQLKVIVALFVVTATAMPYIDSSTLEARELEKRYCGNNPPANPQCHQGLFQVRLLVLSALEIGLRRILQAILHCPFYRSALT